MSNGHITCKKFIMKKIHENLELSTQLYFHLAKEHNKNIIIKKQYTFVP